MKYHPREQGEMVEQWMERLNFIGPFGPLSQLQHIYDEAPDAVQGTPEYRYISGLLQGRKGYQPLPDSSITPEQHLEVLEMVANNSAQYGRALAEQAAGLRDGYSIALGYFGDPRD